ncbi:hypothetical protein HDU83_003479 [Entophlyctis luteolus]|nr:hypothetical protein HDU83_003479 [Entophlyctis luteolus]
MRARNIDPAPQTYTTMISVYESQMLQGNAPERVIRDRLKRVVALKDELIGRKTFSTAHANAILSACIASSNVGGFEVGMEIYSMLQQNFATLLKEAEEESVKPTILDNTLPAALILKRLSELEGSPPIADITTFSLMARFLPKCQRHDLFRSLTEVDFPSSFLIPDETFITAILHYYLTHPSDESRSILLGYSSAVFNLPALMEFMPRAHRKLVYESRLRRSLHVNAKSIVPSSRLMDVLLRALTKLPIYSAKVDAIKLLTQRGVLNEETVDDGVARLVMVMYLNGHDYNGAKSFAEFVRSFPKNEVDESIGIYEDLLSTLAVKIAEEFQSRSSECRRLCTQLISICEQKRLVPFAKSLEVGVVDIPGLKPKPWRCFVRFLLNFQLFIVGCKSLIKKEAHSPGGFLKISFVGLFLAEQYVPVCLDIVAEKKKGVDNREYFKILEASKAVLNQAQESQRLMIKVGSTFEFMNVGEPMEMRVVRWARMVSDIERALENRS